MCPPKDSKKNTHIWTWQGEERNQDGSAGTRNSRTLSATQQVKQKKTPLKGGWETAQQLRALDAFPGDPALLPSTYKVAYNCNSSSRGPDVLFCHPQVPGMHVAPEHKEIHLAVARVRQ